MRIAVLPEPRSFEVVDAPVPDIEPDEVLLRVASCGVCASEVDMWEGRGAEPFPLFLGHEVSGTVERVGADVSSLRQGDRVAAWVTTRGYAEYVAVAARYCLPAHDVPLENALAEPLACAVNVMELANLSLGDDVVIIGAGFMGHLVHKLVTLQGPRHVIVADARSDALARAERIGATRLVDVTAESLVEAVAEVTGGRGVDATFEVTGAQAPLQEVGDVTRMSGKVVIVGYHQGAPRHIPLGQWNWNAFTIVNAHFREVATIMRGMDVAMRLLTAGRVAMDDLVTHRYRLADINRAFEVAHGKPEGFVKATITIDPRYRDGPGSAEG
jgi:L-iditol 2-dehydrogenase